MAEENSQKESVYSADDPLDINELASLNDDISPEFIEQLQNKVAQNASEFTGKPLLLNDDSELFEEVSQNTSSSVPKINFEDNIDDNFIKKYKAKLNKQQEKEQATKENKKQELPPEPVSVQPEKAETVEDSTQKDNDKNEQESKNKSKAKSKSAAKKTDKQPEITIEPQKQESEIENLTSGNIVEKPVAREQIEYNESLDFLDENVKYSKYVIYVDPENTEFIESLTVKERKNLINRLLREQDDIAITKRRLGFVKTVIKHLIIAIITIAITIPTLYWVINASLEASINNYRRSQSIFQTLYKEKGKIKNQKINY